MALQATHAWAVWRGGCWPTWRPASNVARRVIASTWMAKKEDLDGRGNEWATLSTPGKVFRSGCGSDIDAAPQTRCSTTATAAALRPSVR